MRDYNKAHQIDASLQAEARAERIVNFVINASILIATKGKLKSKKLTDMVKTVPSTLPSSVSFPVAEEQKEKFLYNVVAINQLDPGENIGVILSAKIVNHLPKEQEVPMCFLVVDFKYNFSVVSIYHTNMSLEESLKHGDEILIKNPHVVFTSLEFKGKLYTYQTVKVPEIQNILVNGEPLISKYS